MPMLKDIFPSDVELTVTRSKVVGSQITHEEKRERVDFKDFWQTGTHEYSSLRAELARREKFNKLSNTTQAQLKKLSTIQGKDDILKKDLSWKEIDEIVTAIKEAKTASYINEEDHPFAVKILDILEERMKKAIEQKEYTRPSTPPPLASMPSKATVSPAASIGDPAVTVPPQSSTSLPGQPPSSDNKNSSAATSSQPVTTFKNIFGPSALRTVIPAITPLRDLFLRVRDSSELINPDKSIANGWNFWGGCSKEEKRTLEKLLYAKLDTTWELSEIGLIISTIERAEKEKIPIGEPTSRFLSALKQKLNPPQQVSQDVAAARASTPSAGVAQRSTAGTTQSPSTASSPPPQPLSTPPRQGQQSPPSSDNKNSAASSSQVTTQRRSRRAKQQYRMPGPFGKKFEGENTSSPLTASLASTSVVAKAAEVMPTFRKIFEGADAAKTMSSAMAPFIKLQREMETIGQSQDTKKQLRSQSPTQSFVLSELARIFYEQLTEDEKSVLKKFMNAYENMQVAGKNLDLECTLPEFKSMIEVINKAKELGMPIAQETSSLGEVMEKEKANKASPLQSATSSASVSPIPAEPSVPSTGSTTSASPGKPRKPVTTLEELFERNPEVKKLKREKKFDASFYVPLIPVHYLTDIEKKLVLDYKEPYTFQQAQVLTFLKLAGQGKHEDVLKIEYSSEVLYMILMGFRQYHATLQEKTDDVAQLGYFCEALASVIRELQKEARAAVAPPVVDFASRAQQSVPVATTRGPLPLTPGSSASLPLPPTPPEKKAAARAATEAPPIPTTPPQSRTRRISSSTSVPRVGAGSSGLIVTQTGMPPASIVPPAIQPPVAAASSAGSVSDKDKEEQKGKLADLKEMCERMTVAEYGTYIDRPVTKLDLSHSDYDKKAADDIRRFKQKSDVLVKEILDGAKEDPVNFLGVIRALAKLSFERNGGDVRASDELLGRVIKEYTVIKDGKKLNEMAKKSPLEFRVSDDVSKMVAVIMQEAKNHMTEKKLTDLKVGGSEDKFSFYNGLIFKLITSIVVETCCLVSRLPENAWSDLKNPLGDKLKKKQDSSTKLISLKEFSGLLDSYYTQHKVGLLEFRKENSMETSMAKQLAARIKESKSYVESYEILVDAYQLAQSMDEEEAKKTQGAARVDPEYLDLLRYAQVFCLKQVDKEHGAIVLQRAPKVAPVTTRQAAKDFIDETSERGQKLLLESPQKNIVPMT